MNFHKKPNLYIRHITLNISDLHRSLAFYTDFLGFQILEREERKAVLTVDGQSPIIILQQPEGVLPKEEGRSGLYHFAILLPSRAHLGQMLVHLVKNNISLGAADHLVSEALYFNDPDGNGIEIYHDRQEDEWTWRDHSVHMTTDPLDGEGVMKAANGKQWSGMPTNTVMGHIHLHVSHLQEAGTFYRKVLGYDVVCEFGKQALFLSTGRYHHHIGMNTWNGVGAPPPSENSVGMQEYAIAIPDEAYMKKIKLSLQELNLDYLEKDGILYVHDPSNNKISLHIEQ